MRQPLHRFGPSRVVAPFAFQPTRQGLRGGFGALGAGVTSPIGAGAGAGAAAGATTGASIGSAVPVIGTAIGAVVGAVAGAIAGSIDKKDPEQYDFDQAVALWQANRLAVLNIGDKYLVLAGLFDLNLNNPHIPIYLKYGHMGEQKFVTDMVNVIYQAAINGQITAADTPQTIMSRIVQPWIDSWGYGPMVDPHADLINLILVGMIAEYVANQQGNWLARSGDYPFGSLPAFPLQQVLAQSQASTSSGVNPVGSTTTTTAPVVTSTTPITTTAPISVSTPVTPSYSPSGTVLTVSAPTTLYTPYGTFQVAGVNYLMNGAVMTSAPTTAGLAYVNGQVYRYDGNGSTYIWNNGWQSTTQAPAPTAAIAAGLQTATTATTAVNPVGSTAATTTTATTTATATTALTPQQQVATAPAPGTTVAYAPDMSQSGTPLGLPSGWMFEGIDPYNGSWILQNSATGQLGVVWQGSLQPYTSTMFQPATPTTAAQVVTGSGSSGVNTASATTTPIGSSADQSAAPAAAGTSSNTGLLLGVAIVGALFLARPKRRSVH